MLKRLFRHKVILALLAGIFPVLAFPNIELVPFIFFFPVFLNVLCMRTSTVGSAFRYGFLSAIVLMIGAFYWVTYVIHEFGYLPWSISILLFVGFCGIGTLNFPIFTALTLVIFRKLRSRHVTPLTRDLWLVIGIPALFTVLEYFIPKLFPWYISNCLYRLTWLNQIAEITGITFLSFCIYSTGGALCLWLYPDIFPSSLKRLAILPLSAWIICGLFSVYTLQKPFEIGRTLKVALIQANIGSLEKVEAERGVGKKVRTVVDRYKALTEKALLESPKPDLILWPETALPFHLEGDHPYAVEIRDFVYNGKVPLITGAYAPGTTPLSDYNAAYLLEPDSSSARLMSDVYRKNVLLAFGEYMPFGEWFPSLYQKFPTVANFDRGSEQNAFKLKDGTLIGTTICYEDIILSFFRNSVRNGVHAAVNLTNDSWFGPTAEPHQHGALAVFRSIESRTPLIRVTNTGISFTVDHLGKLGPQSPVYNEAIIKTSIVLPKNPPLTFYVRYGDWFVGVCGVIVLWLLFLLLRRNHASLFV